MPDLVSLYHRLPYPLRVVSASLRGYQLHWWRYSRETDQLVGEALEREYWSDSQWDVWQEERLAKLLQRAATTVPYYQRYWQNQRRVGNHASWELLENWPILTKEELRAHNCEFVASDCNPRHMYCEHTSGTSGTPLRIWLRRETLVQWYALFEARWRGWYGLSRRNRWAILGGQLVTPIAQNHPPYWVWNAGLQQLYFSSYHLSKSSVKDYAQALFGHRISYLWGYASTLATLAQYIQDDGIKLPELQRVISNAEPLYGFQRERISKAFNCPVVDTYGMAEMVSAASECNFGVLHLWPEVGVTEILCDDSNEPQSKDHVGRLICTGLLNMDMPLVRYEVGDRGALKSEVYQCSCGRNLPGLSQIEGRNDDVIVARDGRKIGRLDPIFKADLHIREAQIEQNRLEYFVIRIVPGMGFSEQEGRIIIDRLKQRVGDVEVDIEIVSAIPKNANGKFRAVISSINNPKIESA